MGKLMLNNINYTGGSGGTNVIPNPPETATDDLTSIKIDNTVYNLAGGGGNVYGAFIDTNRVLYSQNEVSNVDYTAVEDCYVMLNLESKNTGSAWAYVDGELVGRVYGTQGETLGTVGIYLKRGQRVTTTNTGTIGQYIRVYGLTFGTQNIFTPQIYSKKERCVGVWIDNKPLYCKTWDLQTAVTLPSDGFTLPNDIQADLQDAEIIVGGFAIRSTSNNATIPLTVYNANGVKNCLYVDSWGNVSKFTFYYTKTTDVAGSGSYNTLGVPTVHYTTDEQVIGTYLGKPLYQRVITPIVTASTTLAGDIKYGSVVLGDYINSVDMAFVDLSASYIESATGATRGLISAHYEKDSGNIVIVTMFTRTNSPSSLCIKYTKITD